MSKIYKTDGNIVDVAPKNGTDFTLAEIQRYVGGHFELLRIPGGWAILNEDGHALNLPYNQLASVLLNQTIVGDCLVCGTENIK